MLQHIDEIAVAAICGAAITLFIFILRAARPPKEDPRMAAFRQRLLTHPPPKINGHARVPTALRETRTGEITVLSPKK